LKKWALRAFILSHLKDSFDSKHCSIYYIVNVVIGNIFLGSKFGLNLNFLSSNNFNTWFDCFDCCLVLIQIKSSCLISRNIIGKKYFFTDLNYNIVLWNRSYSEFSERDKLAISPGRFEYLDLLLYNRNKSPIFTIILKRI